ncbi:MAG: hypothetical protein JWP14_878 [Frankiales bacterium]|jgi:hypothetical protein|nr:hypothetical protein [Frankiales bacterium]
MTTARLRTGQPTEVLLIVDETEASAAVLAMFERLKLEHSVNHAGSRHGAVTKPAISYELDGKHLLAEGEAEVQAWIREHTHALV